MNNKRDVDDVILAAEAAAHDAAEQVKSPEEQMKVLRSQVRNLQERVRYLEDSWRGWLANGTGSAAYQAGRRGGT